MPLRLHDKKKIVASLADIAGHASSVVVADYRGLDVQRMSTLRKEARHLDVHLHVVRNSLARRAFESTAFSCLCKELTGPLIFAFSKSDPGSAARLFRNFIAKNKELKVKVLSISGQLLLADALEQLADLPTHQQAVVLLVRSLIGPMTCSIKVMSVVFIQFVRLCSVVVEQKRVS